MGNTAPLDDNLVITDDETSDAFEFGFKGNAFDKRVSFTANAFYQTFDNYGARTPQTIRMASGRNGIIDSVLKANYNADAIVKGLERTIWGKPSAFWDVSVSTSYTDAEFDGGVRPCNRVDGNGDIFVPIGPQASFCEATGKMGISLRSSSRPTPSIVSSRLARWNPSCAASSPLVRALSPT